jgi:hypothetical protein
VPAYVICNVTVVVSTLTVNVDPSGSPVGSAPSVPLNYASVVIVALPWACSTRRPHSRQGSSVSENTSGV